MSSIRDSKLILVLLMFILATTLANCGRGGKAHYELEPISEEKAIALLEKSAGDKEKTEAVLQRVNDKRRADFDFAKFWALAKEKGVAQKLPPEQQKKLLDLHEKSCKDADFDEFAKLVLRLGREQKNFDTYNYIVGEFRQCQTALSPLRMRDFVLRTIINPGILRSIRVNSKNMQQKQQIHAGLEEWEREFEYMYGVSPKKAATIPQEDQTKLISRILLREILLSPETNWGTLVCFLNLDDMAEIQRTLENQRKQRISILIENTFQNECIGQGP